MNNSISRDVLRQKKTLKKRCKKKRSKNTSKGITHKVKVVKDKKINLVTSSSDSESDTTELKTSNLLANGNDNKAKLKVNEPIIDPSDSVSETGNESEQDISNLLVFGGNVNLKKSDRKKLKKNPFAKGVPDNTGIFDGEGIQNASRNKKDETRYTQARHRELIQNLIDREEHISVTETEPTSVAVCLFLVPSRNGVIIVLEHGTSVTLEGMVNVSVISGLVSIHGVQLSFGMPPMKVCSFVKLCCLKLEATTAEHIWKHTNNFVSLRSKLEDVTCPKTAAEILSKVDNSSVILLVERFKVPLPINFVFRYSSSVIQKNEKTLSENFSLKQFGFSIRKSDAEVPSTVMFKPLASQILNLIQTSKIYDIPGPRILVYGAKNVGKSTLLRYLINATLQKYEKVLYLDCDLGQTEFNIPGTVSLTEVTDPLLGPPFTHRKDSLMTVFIGNFTIEDSPEMFKNGVLKLLEFYTSNYSSLPLFVNTMGWIEGIGAVCLTEVIRCSKPSLMIELIPSPGDSLYTFQDDQENPFTYEKLIFNVPKPKHVKDSSFTSRELMILSYFGQCQRLFDPPKTLNAFEPYSVSWKHLALYVFHKYVPPEKLPYAMNASIVALCVVDDSVILESDVPSFPKTLQPNPIHNCLGFGIVRAIDVTKQLFYIVTPVPKEQLEKVNALLKGNIMLPPSLFLKQNIDCVPLPYVKDVIDNFGPLPKGERFIPKRKRMFLR